MSKTIWVMGARGFVGSQVARCAAARGHLVLGLGHGAWLPDDAAASGVSVWVNGEIDDANLDGLAAHGLPDGIIHCAGGSSVGISIAAPFEDYSRSVTSTARLLEWLRRRAPACRFVLASSAAVYGGGPASGIAESAACSPASPYGAHKLAAEVLVRGAARAFGMRAGIVRPFSLYGEELRKQLIWDICQKLRLQPEALTLGGSGEELRDFVHVADAAAFFVDLFERLDDSESGVITVNCGTGVARSIRQIAETVCSAWSLSAAPRFSGSERAGDPVHLVADATAASEFGFVPSVNFEVGIRCYVDWFRSRYPAP